MEFDGTSHEPPPARAGPWAAPLFFGALVAGFFLAGATVGRTAPRPPRLVVEGDTVLDTRTGLRWKSRHEPAPMPFEEATLACARHGDGWRLPGVIELQSLVDPRRKNPPIDPALFPDTPNAFFWAGHRVNGPTPAAWGVDHHFGDALIQEAVEPSYVRCVRLEPA